MINIPYLFRYKGKAIKVGSILILSRNNGDWNTWFWKIFGVINPAIDR
jgi:hypothetical protein